MELERLIVRTWNWVSGSEPQRLWAALKDSGPWPMKIIGKLEEEHKDDLSWIYLLDSHVHTVRIKSTCYFPQRKIDPPLEALADWVCS
jgi:hypothetical protein